MLLIERIHVYIFSKNKKKNKPEMELKPTRIFNDENGNTYAFFGSYQAKDMLRKCKDSVDFFITNH